MFPQMQGIQAEAGLFHLNPWPPKIFWAVLLVHPGAGVPDAALNSAVSRVILRAAGAISLM